MDRELKYAPREVFEQILEYSVIPTFDLVIEVPGRGAIIVKRKIEPYANKWALPGLRMFKPEEINETLARIARDEVGLDVDLGTKRFLGQYVGKFKTEHDRQDLSTGYAVKSNGEDISINSDHFSNYKFINSVAEIPQDTGAMYKSYLGKYFESIG